MIAPPSLAHFLLTHALHRRRTCSQEAGGDGDAYVQKKEFKALLANIFFFNKLFLVFEDIDTGDDRRIDFGEFIRGCSRLGKSCCFVADVCVLQHCVLVSF
jgi:hypothetical protein